MSHSQYSIVPSCYPQDEPHLNEDGMCTCGCDDCVIDKEYELICICDDCSHPDGGCVTSS